MTETSTWVYVLANAVSDADQKAILQGLEEFMKTWTYHDRNVEGKARIDFSQILVLQATVQDGSISGCGIDKSVHAVEGILLQHGVELAPTLSVCYIAEDVAHVVTRKEFSQLSESGAIGEETLCVQPGTDEGGTYLIPLVSSWHARLLSTTSPL